MNFVFWIFDDEKTKKISMARTLQAMGVDEEKEVIPEKVAILEEIIEEEDGEDAIYVDRVTDPEQVIILTGILKPLAVSD